MFVSSGLPIAEFKGVEASVVSRVLPSGLAQLSCVLPPRLLLPSGSEPDQQEDVYGDSKCAGSTFQTGAGCCNPMLKDHPALRM